MHKLTLLVLGQSKPSAVDTLLQQYMTWSRQFADVQVQVLKEAKVREGALHLAAQEDTETILRAVPVGATLVVLDNTGKTMSTEEFAGMIGHAKDQGVSMAFAIGGAYGFDRALLSQRQHVRLSLSPMVTTHQIVRVFFGEQLYRALTIIAGKTYHHG